MRQGRKEKEKKEGKPGKGEGARNFKQKTDDCYAGTSMGVGDGKECNQWTGRVITGQHR